MGDDGGIEEGGDGGSGDTGARNEWNDSTLDERVASASLSDSGMGWNLASKSLTDRGGSVTDRFGDPGLKSMSIGAEGLMSSKGLSDSENVLVDALSSVVFPSE